jgi:hypothetical protein
VFPEGLPDWAVSVGPLLSGLQSFEAKAHEFRRGMKPTAGETLIVAAFVGCGGASEVRIRTLSGGR